MKFVYACVLYIWLCKSVPYICFMVYTFVGARFSTTRMVQKLMTIFMAIGKKEH
jgi:hypothetical protein